jgi:hypothetical protein
MFRVLLRVDDRVDIRDALNDFFVRTPFAELWMSVSNAYDVFVEMISSSFDSLAHLKEKDFLKHLQSQDQVGLVVWYWQQFY